MTPDRPAGEAAERLRRRADREKRARLEAEAIAERATTELYGVVAELRAAEARARVVTETAALLLEGRLDTTATLEVVADAARRALGARRATFFISSRAEDRVETVVSTETDPEARRLLEWAAGRPRAALPMSVHGAVALIPDVAAEGALPGRVQRGLGSGALIGVRLEHVSTARADASMVLGSFFVAWEEPREITRNDELVARSLAGMASLALANARLAADTLASLAEAEERASLDPLTGLANHRTFHDRLTHEAARAGRHGRALSLALFDVDRFKAVNDLHGHQVGDDVLVAVARVLEEQVREGDLIARVGGEEFAWLMPESDGLDAWQAAERARQAVAAATFAPVGAMTVSAGVCDLAQAADAAHLYRLADGALYWSKHHGRDVVYLYSPDVVRALSAEEQATRLRRQQALQSIRMLARAVDAKDSFTRLHSERVADLAARIAAELGWPEERAERLHEAGLVHDVGKLAIPDVILLKAGPLTSDEYATLRTHAAVGAEIVSEAFDAEQVAWVRGHHERWDGRGYPDGIGAGEIADGAAILALADAWDAMTSARPYRMAGTMDDALAECLRERGAQFAPWAVDALVRLRPAEAPPVPASGAA